jgi:hypothetical protein
MAAPTGRCDGGYTATQMASFSNKWRRSQTNGVVLNAIAGLGGLQKNAFSKLSFGELPLSSGAAEVES